MPVRHLPVEARQRLAARLACLRPLESNRVELLSRGQGAVYDAMRAKVDNLSDPEQGLLDADFDRLDDFVKAFVTSVRKSGLETSKETREGKLARDVIAGLELSQGEIDCARCSGRRTGIARCSPSTDSLLTLLPDAECISALRNIFLEARQCSSDCYVESGLLAEVQLPDIVFSTSYVVGGRPHDLPLNRYLTGLTAYEGSASVVTLKLNPYEFDWKCYLSTFYVLTHECLVHGVQGMQGGSARRAAPPSDSFSEGWMDWIAFRAAEQWLNRKRSRGRRLEEQRATTAMHDARYELDVPRESGFAKPRFALLRERGREAAQRLLAWFETLPSRTLGGFTPWSAFLRLSFALNLLWAPGIHSMRAKWTTLVYGALSVEGPQFCDTATERQFVVLVGDYFASGDALGLLTVACGVFDRMRSELELS